MEFEQLQHRAREIRHQYAQQEEKRYGRSWTPSEIALGFVGDVGDLAKLVMAKANVRRIADTDEKLAHELADCLWSIIILADAHDINLEDAFTTTMDQLEKSLTLNSGK